MINQEVNERIFEAISQLQQSGKIRTFDEFCKENGFVRTNLLRLRKEKHRQIPFKVLQTLVIRYNISAHWLVTGIHPI